MLRTLFSHTHKSKSFAQELMELIERDEGIDDQLKLNIQKDAAVKLIDDLGGIDVTYLPAELNATRKGELHDIMQRHQDCWPVMYISQCNQQSDADHAVGAAISIGNHG